LTGLMIVALAGCSSNRNSVSRSAPSVQFASGPISKACLASDRKARSSRLCGCVQASADRVLSSAEQRRAARFFRDPHEAQDVRQSDRPQDEAFWPRYRRFVAVAEGSCRGM